MKLNDVNAGVHKNKKRTRVGRGPGSGHGKTSGRGHKGQGQLAGWSAPSVFEGARMPLVRRVPKRGFNNMWGRIVHAVNLGDIDGAFAAGAEVNPQSLKAAGVVNGRFELLKILGDGELSKKLKIAAHKFSKSAREKIERAGGECVVIPGPAPVIRLPASERKKKASAREKKAKK